MKSITKTIKSIDPILLTLLGVLVACLAICIPLLIIFRDEVSPTYLLAGILVGAISTGIGTFTGGRR